MPNGYKTILDADTSLQDIDVLFKQKDFENVNAILKSFCKQSNYEIVQCYDQDIYAKNFFLYNEGTQQFLNLDICGKLIGKHITFFSENELFPTSEIYKGIPVLKPHQEFVYYLVKRIDKTEISKPQFEHLKTLFDKNVQECLAYIKRYVNSDTDILQKAFEQHNYEMLKANLEGLAKAVIRNRKLSVAEKVKNQFRIFKRIIQPTGFSIAFLGPDGSGKSTVIEGVVTSELPFRRVDYFHLKPFPTKNGMTSQTVTDPHALPPYSVLKSYLKLCVFIMQYNYGWLINIITLKIKSSLIIFDRYYDDIIVDHKRYRYGGNVGMAKLVRWFIPKPNLYVILTAAPEIIHSRKQEVTIDELRRQVKAYKTLVDDKRYINVDVSQPPETIVKKVINETMRKRYAAY
ncbi:MAG: hypothetical protein HRT67_02975 [Flavobacteriaceae bacterium]|nr:hypothetical protein [Flavobacteriaceae bacterium]